jgi:hypothetical protein
MHCFKLREESLTKRGFEESYLDALSRHQLKTAKSLME